MITMETSELKQELIKLIDQETDLLVLEAIKYLLVNPELNPDFKEKLNTRALNAEEDIKAGKVYSREEFDKKLYSRLKLKRLFGQV